MATTLKLNTITVIVISAIAVFLLCVIFRGCNNPTLNTVDKKSFDSLLLAKKESEKATGIVIDSIFKENNRRAVNEQFLSKKLESKDQQLSIKEFSVVSLAKQVQLYAKYKDTTDQLRAAPLLADQVIGLVEEVGTYKYANKLLLNSIDSSVGATSLMLAKKDYQYTELQGQFDFLAGKYSKQGYELKQAAKKAEKRVVIGPQVGISYINGKPTIYAGIGATYRIIRL